MHEFLLHLGQLSWASISRSLSRMELVSIQLSPCLNHELLSGRVLLCYTLEKPERLCSQVGDGRWPPPVFAFFLLPSAYPRDWESFKKGE